MLHVMLLHVLLMIPRTAHSTSTGMVLTSSKALTLALTTHLVGVHLACTSWIARESVVVNAADIALT